MSVFPLLLQCSVCASLTFYDLAKDGRPTLTDLIGEACQAFKARVLFPAVILQIYEHHFMSCSVAAA